jgi:hypothetical protein
MHPVAVIFDLVQPAAAYRRLVYQAHELRLDPLKADFESVKLESTRIIDIESFVPAHSANA